MWITNLGIKSSNGTGDKSPYNTSSYEWWYWNGTNWKQPVDSGDIIIQSKYHLQSMSRKSGQLHN